MTEIPPWLKLLSEQRWAALGTIDADQYPYVSSVAYCPSQGGLLFHLSQLAAHTGYMQSRPATSLLIAEPDTGTGDPQTLARLSLTGQSTAIARDSEAFETAAGQYIARFPDSEMRFGLGDFHLFHFVPEKGNFVGGFGKAGRISGEKIIDSLNSLSFT